MTAKKPAAPDPERGRTVDPWVSDAAAAKWRAGRALHGPKWSGAHPLAELLDELLDAFNYLSVSESGGCQVPGLRQVLLDAAALVQARLAALEPAELARRDWPVAEIRVSESDEEADDSDLMLGIYGLGWIHVTRSELRKHDRAPAAFSAAAHGVSIERYVAWRFHHENAYLVPTCPRKTKKGRSCRGYVVRTEDPADFITGQSDLCVTHRR